MSDPRPAPRLPKFRLYSRRPAQAFLALPSCLRRRARAAMPAMPVPKRIMVAGSGTAAGPWPSLKLVKEPVSSLVEAKRPRRVCSR